MFRWDGRDERTAYLVLSPNPVVWLVALLGIIGGLVTLLRSAVARQELGSGAVQCAGLVASWSALMAVNLVLSTSRVMYVYHYLPNLFIGLVAGAYAGKRLAPARRAMAAAIALPLALCAFALESPLIYHRYLSPKACHAREAAGFIPRCR